jgi:hypothetical protein
MRRLRGEQFCSPEHMERFTAQQADTALERLAASVDERPNTMRPPALPKPVNKFARPTPSGEPETVLMTSTERTPAAPVPPAVQMSTTQERPVAAVPAPDVGVRIESNVRAETQSQEPIRSPRSRPTAVVGGSVPWAPHLTQTVAPRTQARPWMARRDPQWVVPAPARGRAPLAWPSLRMEPRLTDAQGRILDVPRVEISNGSTIAAPVMASAALVKPAPLPPVPVVAKTSPIAASPPSSLPARSISRKEAEGFIATASPKELPQPITTYRFLRAKAPGRASGDVLSEQSFLSGPAVLRTQFPDLQAIEASVATMPSSESGQPTLSAVTPTTRPSDQFRLRSSVARGNDIPQTEQGQPSFAGTVRRPHLATSAVARGLSSGALHWIEQQPVPDSLKAVETLRPVSVLTTLQLPSGTSLPVPFTNDRPLISGLQPLSDFARLKSGVLGPIAGATASATPVPSPPLAAILPTSAPPTDPFQTSFGRRPLAGIRLAAQRLRLQGLTSEIATRKQNAADADTWALPRRNSAEFDAAPQLSPRLLLSTLEVRLRPPVNPVVGMEPVGEVRIDVEPYEGELLRGNIAVSDAQFVGWVSHDVVLYAPRPALSGAGMTQSAPANVQDRVAVELMGAKRRSPATLTSFPGPQYSVISPRLTSLKGCVAQSSLNCWDAPPIKATGYRAIGPFPKLPVRFPDTHLQPVGGNPPPPVLELSAKRIAPNPHRAGLPRFGPPTPLGVHPADFLAWPNPKGSLAERAASTEHLVEPTPATTLRPFAPHTPGSDSMPPIQPTKGPATNAIPEEAAFTPPGPRPALRRFGPSRLQMRHPTADIPLETSRPKQATRSNQLGEK